MVVVCIVKDCSNKKKNKEKFSLHTIRLFLAVNEEKKG